MKVAGGLDADRWYTTLRERFEGQVVDAKVYHTRRELWTIITALLPGPTSRLHIPHADEEYVLMRASSDPEVLFFPPYDPVIITHKRHGIVGVLTQYSFAARAVDGAFLASTIPDELEIIAKDPVGYFESMGQRYGKCLVCGRELKREESLERAMGPVCYGRVAEAQRVAKEAIYDDASELAEARDVHHGIFEMNHAHTWLTPDEILGLQAFNRTLETYYRSGFHIGPTGALLFGTHERYPAYILPRGIATENPLRQVALRPVAATDYTALSASLIRQGITTLEFNEEAGAFVVPRYQYEQAKISKDSLVLTRPPIIEPLRQLPASGDGEDTQSVSDVTSSSSGTLTKRKALFQWSDDRSEMLIYSYPPALQATLNKIRGARYDRKIKRMRIPASERATVEEFLALEEART